MPLGGPAGPGPFRGLLAYDERNAQLFFGRSKQTAALLQQVSRDGARVTALTGEVGVGKSSLLRAGLTPGLARQGVFGLYLGAYEALDQEIWQGASRAGAEPPAAGETPGDYLIRLVRASRSGTLLMLDHLEGLLAARGPALAQLGTLLAGVAGAAGPRLRFLLCIDSGSFHRLDQLHAATGFAPLPGTWRELPRLEQGEVTEILEQTALQTGTFFEAGLAAVMAADLCREHACLPSDLQIVARTVIDLRLTSIRRYERSGGAEMLIQTFFDRVITEAGGRAGRRVLQELASLVIGPQSPGSLSLDELASRTGLPRPRVDHAATSLVARGLLTRREGDRL